RILTRPSRLSRILAGFRSRPGMRAKWAAAKPVTICTAQSSVRRQQHEYEQVYRDGSENGAKSCVTAHPDRLCEFRASADHSQGKRRCLASSGVIVGRDADETSEVIKSLIRFDGGGGVPIEL